MIDDLRGIAGYLSKTMLDGEGTSPNGASKISETISQKLGIEEGSGSKGSPERNDPPRESAKEELRILEAHRKANEEARVQQFLDAKAALVIDDWCSDKTNEKERGDSPNDASTISGSGFAKVRESGSKRDIESEIDRLKESVRDLTLLAAVQREINDINLGWHKNFTEQSKAQGFINEQLAIMNKTRFDR